MSQTTVTARLFTKFIVVFFLNILANYKKKIKNLNRRCESTCDSDFSQVYSHLRWTISIHIFISLCEINFPSHSQRTHIHTDMHLFYFYYYYRLRFFQGNLFDYVFRSLKCFSSEMYWTCQINPIFTKQC